MDFNWVLGLMTKLDDYLMKAEVDIDLDEVSPLLTIC